MPIYEYECSDCKKVFEQLVTSEQDQPRECLFCKKMNIKKIISSSTFHLKGGGWEKDGYSSKMDKFKKIMSDT